MCCMGLSADELAELIRPMDEDDLVFLVRLLVLFESAAENEALSDLAFVGRKPCYSLSKKKRCRIGCARRVRLH